MKKKKNYKTYHFYLPQYWPLWLVVFIAWSLVQLPYRFQMKLGEKIGLILFRYSKKAKHVSKVNIELCFPEKTEQEKTDLLKASFISLGKAVFETGLGFWGSKKRLEKLGHFHGLKKAQTAQKEKGLFLIGAHFTTLEIAGRLFAMHYPLSVMYRPHKIPFFNFIIEKSLNKHYDHAISRETMRPMFKALKQKKAVWYSADVNTKRQHSVFAPFFGIQALTCKAPSKLADKTQCACFFGYHFRRDDNTGYDIYFDEIDNFPTDDMEADATLINALIEKAVRKKPEQYLWSYMRFKTRPMGDRRVYTGALQAERAKGL